MAKTTTSGLSKTIARKEIVVYLGFISFVVGFLYYYFPSALGVNTAGIDISGWSVAFAYFAVFSGTTLWLRSRIRNVLKRTKGLWMTSIITISIFGAITIISLIIGVSDPNYVNFTTLIFSPVDVTSKSMIGFATCLAAYYVFIRYRNWQTTAALGLAFLVMIKDTPIGSLIFNPNYSNFITFLINTLESGGYAAFLVCAAFGSVLLGVRLLLGRELRIYGRE